MEITCICRLFYHINVCLLTYVPVERFISPCRNNMLLSTKLTCATDNSICLWPEACNLCFCMLICNHEVEMSMQKSCEVYLLHMVAQDIWLILYRCLC